MAPESADLSKAAESMLRPWTVRLAGSTLALEGLRDDQRFRMSRAPSESMARRLHSLLDGVSEGARSDADRVERISQIATGIQDRALRNRILHPRDDLRALSKLPLDAAR